MKQPDRTPTYNMKVVVQETGLKPDTLRAWERRYGVPSPERTSGGHRLYSQYEIEMLKWLIARQDEGLTISHAVDLWQQLVEQDENPLEVRPLQEEEPAFPLPATGDSLATLREAWLEACMTFDEQRAQHVLAQAFAIFPVETVCLQILQKALSWVGQRWYEGEVSVQQEHFTSTQAIRQLEALLSAMSTAVRRGERILVACPPMEQHTFSPLLVTLMLRQRGWDVVYLGANVPLERLESTIRTVKPALVILSAQTLTTAGTLREMAELLAEMKVPMAFGGAVFNVVEGVKERIPGHFLGDKLEKVPESVQSLLQTQPRIPAVPELPSGYQEALHHFRNRRAAIEAEVYHALQDSRLTTTELNNANQDLGNNISAALRLGDISLMDANVEWVRGLLVNYHYRMPEEAMEQFVHVYDAAAQEHLDERGAPLLNWLADLVAS